MKTITTRGQSFNIPTCVGELSPKQYQYYCFLAFALSGNMIDLDYFKIRWFSYLTGLGKLDYIKLKEPYAAELHEQIQAIDGFFVKNTVDGVERVQIDFDTVANLLPEYRGYQGPGNLLQGVTFGEFVECFTVAECMDETDTDGIARGYAHIARILYHIPESDTVPDLLSFHAPRLFTSVWRAIQNGPIEINGRKIDFRIIFKSSGGHRTDDKTGWTGITFEVASAGLFGNVREVESADLWAVLMYLYKCKFEYLNDKRNSRHS